jgi:hypothetical protein
MESWRGRKAVLASRGEINGPRVAECDAALAWWRIRSRLVSEMGITEKRAEALLDLIVPQSGQTVDVEPIETDAATVTP